MPTHDDLGQPVPLMTRSEFLRGFVATGAAVGFSGIAGQAVTQQSANYKFSTPIAPGIASPAKVDTRLGTLHFVDSVPDQVSTNKIYDSLDFQRAVLAYLRKR